MDGNNTQWTQEGANTIGNVVSEYITSRTSDGKVIVGTHGRGAFVAYGNASTNNNPILTLAVNQLNINVKPGLTGNTNFDISNTGNASLTYSITPSGGPAKIIGQSNKISKNELLNSNRANSDVKPKVLRKGNVNNIIKQKTNPLLKTSGEDVLILDDGNDYPDDFIGVGTGRYLYWQNIFNVTKDFALQKIRWYTFMY